MNKQLEKIETTEGGQVLSMIERVVMSPDVPLDRLEKMLDMQEKILKRQEVSAFNAALVTAMAEMPAIPLNGVGHQSKKYALLKDIINITRPVLAKFGLAMTFGVVTDEKTVKATAKLRHTLGHMDEVTITLPHDGSGSKNPVQGVGSSQAYGQRYAAQAILGLSLGDDIDDDGKSLTKGTVSVEQFIQLRDRLEESGTPEKTLLAAYKASSLEQFPAKEFDSAMKRLQLTIEKKKGATDGTV